MWDITQNESQIQKKSNIFSRVLKVFFSLFFFFIFWTLWYGYYLWNTLYQNGDIFDKFNIWLSTLAIKSFDIDVEEYFQKNISSLWTEKNIRINLEYETNKKNEALQKISIKNLDYFAKNKWLQQWLHIDEVTSNQPEKLHIKNLSILWENLKTYVYKEKLDPTTENFFKDILLIGNILEDKKWYVYDNSLFIEKFRTDFNLEKENNIIELLKWFSTSNPIAYFQENNFFDKNNSFSFDTYIKNYFVLEKNQSGKNILLLNKDFCKNVETPVCATYVDTINWSIQMLSLIEVVGDFENWNYEIHIKYWAFTHIFIEIKDKKINEWFIKVNENAENFSMHITGVNTTFHINKIIVKTPEISAEIIDGNGDFVMKKDILDKKHSDISSLLRFKNNKVVVFDSKWTTEDIFNHRSLKSHIQIDLEKNHYWFFSEYLDNKEKVDIQYKDGNINGDIFTWSGDSFKINGYYKNKFDFKIDFTGKESYSFYVKYIGYNHISYIIEDKNNASNFIELKIKKQSDHYVFDFLANEKDEFTKIHGTLERWKVSYKIPEWYEEVKNSDTMVVLPKLYIGLWKWEWFIFDQLMFLWFRSWFSLNIKETLNKYIPQSSMYGSEKKTLNSRTQKSSFSLQDMKEYMYIDSEFDSDSHSHKYQRDLQRIDKINEINTYIVSYYASNKIYPDLKDIDFILQKISYKTIDTFEAQNLDGCKMWILYSLSNDKNNYYLSSCLESKIAIIKNGKKDLWFSDNMYELSSKFDVILYKNNIYLSDVLLNILHSETQKNNEYNILEI